MPMEQAIVVRYRGPGPGPAYFSVRIQSRQRPFRLSHAEMERRAGNRSHVREAVAAEAAKEVCRRMKWQGTLVAGGLVDGRIVFVFQDPEATFPVT
jgi:hypothetical protein